MAKIVYQFEANDEHVVIEPIRRDGVFTAVRFVIFCHDSVEGRPDLATVKDICEYELPTQGTMDDWIKSLAKNVVGWCIWDHTLLPLSVDYGRATTQVSKVEKMLRKAIDTGETVC